jgi:cyclopropane fatty-acyl-phospholipid synthase-like methyltransferase
MFYFNDEKKAEEYIKMAEGYDGIELIAKLEKYLTSESSILELGMGPGIDLDYLSGKYRATGSDLSDIFISRYQGKHPEIPVLKLDAVSITTEQRFDCIYSNKVLHHLSKSDLHSSLGRQREVVNPGGILLHSFWLGEGAENYDGLFFQYYSEEDILEIAEKYFKIQEYWIYTEMENDDSIGIIMK